VTKRNDDEIPLYFAFPDGVFHYVCAECTALCCRGQGFAGSLKREMPALMALYPALGSAVVSRQASMVTFGTPAGRCFFLDQDNLCRIERDHGKDLKPGVCSLFPFNAFMRIGEVVSIRPHFMCPIRLQVPARPGEVEGTHTAIDAAARASGLLDREYIKSYLPAASLHPALDAVAVVNRETSFRDACARSIGHQSFYATLKEESSDPGALDTITSRAAKVMGLAVDSTSRERDRTDDLLLALAPSHRLSLLHMSSEAILRALAIGEVVLRQIMPLSSIPMSPQGAYSVLNNIAPAVRLLALGDETVELAARASLKSPPFGDPEMAFAAFAVLRKLGATAAVLDSLEKAIKPGMTIPDRSALLVQLGSQIDHSRAKSPKKRARKKTLQSDDDQTDA
jgi:hypothetical protein